MEQQLNNEAHKSHITKNVMVLMPFRTGNGDGEKLSYLDFLRIKYLIEDQITIRATYNPSVRIKYKVSYFRKGAGNITEQAFKEFRKNDLFVALITEANVNVIYEIAVLNVPQEELIILIDIDQMGSELSAPGAIYVPEIKQNPFAFKI